MAFIEQLVYALGASGTAPAMLARTAGVTRELATEITHICAGWALSRDDLQLRPAFMSMPLRNTLPGTPGRLYAAARALGDGSTRALSHVLVLAETDYAPFNLSPYRLDKEKLFLDRWAPGLHLEQMERKPASLAPLVMPLAGSQDAELVAEALRSYFVAGRLILPLVRADELSERFLTLFLESLPVYAKRNVCFASFAPAGQAGFNVGATFAPDGSFRGWQRSLVASARSPLLPQFEDYVAEARRCLSAGDIMGLEKASRALDGVPQPGRTGPAPAPRRQSMTAAFTTATAPVAEVLTWQRSEVPKRKPPGAGHGGAESGPQDAQGKKHRGGLALVALAIVVGAALLLVGLPRRGRGPSELPPPRPAATAAAPAAPAPRPAAAPNEESPPVQVEAAAAASALGGIIDTGSLYASELEAFRGELLATASAARRRERGEQALASLRERGAGDLRRQSLDFCREAGDGIRETGRPDREASRAQALLPRATAITRELRRLVLGAYAFATGNPWDDLGRLDEARLTVRWDSLRREDPTRLDEAAKRLELADLIDRVTAARRDLVGRQKLARLLAQPRRDAGWASALEAAAGGQVGESVAATEAAWRESALALAALKRAEDAAGFKELAFVADYAGGAWLPAPVREAVEALRDVAARRTDGTLPPLAIATLELYDGLARIRNLAANDGATEALGATISALGHNAAIAFDPDAYGDHVERSRVVALASQLARGRNAEAVPAAMFPGEDRRATLAFLSMAQSAPDSVAWHDFARTTQAGFLKRWASRRAATAQPPQRLENDRFDAEFLRLATATAELAAKAQRGQDWTETMVALRAALADFKARYRSSNEPAPDRREKLARIDGLFAALEKPLPVRLDAVTVRLAPEQLRSPAEVQVQLEADGGDALCRSDAMLLQLAEDGGGWVATRPLGLDLTLRPGQSVRAIVQRIADGRVLFTVAYGTAAEAMLPGALMRPRSGRAPVDSPGVAAGETPGSVAFAVPEWVWRRLKLPDLRQPVAVAEGRAAGAP